MNNSTRAVLEIMRVYDGACQETFGVNKMFRYSARIFDLRKLGYKIGARPCRSPIHAHINPIKEYFIEGTP